MATWRCPICDRVFEPGATPTAPFCSERCRMVDLGRWFKEGYGVPRPPAEDEDPEAPPPREFQE